MLQVNVWAHHTTKRIILTLNGILFFLEVLCAVLGTYLHGSLLSYELSAEDAKTAAIMKIKGLKEPSSYGAYFSSFHVTFRSLTIWPSSDSFL